MARRLVLLALAGSLVVSLAGARPPSTDIAGPIDVAPKPIATDKTVKYDYDIVYVRAPRKGDAVGTNWTEISNPVIMDAGADLMLLHPDGSEEVLVTGGDGSVTDPFVSFDGEWVYYSLFHDLKAHRSRRAPPPAADIYKIHVKTQQDRPADAPGVHAEHRAPPNWSKDFRTPEPGKNYLDYGVYNLGPCPLPGGKLIFTSNRNGFKPPKRLPHTPATVRHGRRRQQRRVHRPPEPRHGAAPGRPEGRPGHVQLAGIAGAAQLILWGIWTHPPRRHQLGPARQRVPAGRQPERLPLPDAALRRHDRRRGVLQPEQQRLRRLLQVPAAAAGRLRRRSAPATRTTRATRRCATAGIDNGRPRLRRLPFSPYGIESLTPLRPHRRRARPTSSDRAARSDSPARRQGHASRPARRTTTCSTVWSPGPVNGGYTVTSPAVDGGIYLIKDGKPIDEPGQMLLIKNDPKYNEQWPRALVPYKRIYGVDEPKRLPPLANDGKLSPHLPEGTPFGLVGTSSLYKRESYPERRRAAGQRDRDATPASNDPLPGPRPVQHDEQRRVAQLGQPGRRRRPLRERRHPRHPHPGDGADDRPQRRPKSGRPFYNHASERLRILGEIPVRKFDTDGKQPLDPDGNPDTSFLAKIPADVAFTFQTLDKDGMVLNMAQTWHQVRPGEIRNDCGGCHAHSQKPTDFKKTAAAKPDYAVFDLTQQTPLLTTKANDESGKKWDAKDETGLRFEKGVKNVEYLPRRQADPRAQLRRLPHAEGGRSRPATWSSTTTRPCNLPDADDVPGTYYRLAMDYAGRVRAQAGHPARGGRPERLALRPHVPVAAQPARSGRSSAAARRLEQRRLPDRDACPATRSTLQLQGPAGRRTRRRTATAPTSTYTGSVMPPPEAVKAGKVAAADRRGPAARWCAGSTSAARSTSTTTRKAPRSAATAGCSTTSGRR